MALFFLSTVKAWSGRIKLSLHAEYLREGMDGEGAPSSAGFNIPGTINSSVSERRWIGKGEG